MPEINTIGLLVANNIKAMLAYWDKDHICRFANKAYLEWFGKAQQEMVDRMNLRDFFGAHYEQYLPYVNRVLQGTAQQFEREIKIPSGEVRWVQVDYVPHLVDETVQGFFVHAADITSIKALENRLASSETKFKGIIEGLPDAIILSNEADKIELVNSAAEKLLEYSHQELIGGNFSILFKGAQPTSVCQDQQSGPLKSLMITKSGNVISAELNLTLVHLEDGVYHCTSVRDISSRVKAEQDLLESNERNKIFVQQAPNAIAMFDKNMRYLAASQKWIQDYKLENINILNRSHYEIFPEIGEDWKKIHRDCLNGQINTCPESKFERADGSRQWIRWDVRPWYISEGNIGGLLMYTEDITTAKEAEYELHRINEELQLILNSGHVSIIGTDKNGIITHFNRGAENMLQYSASEMVGKKTPAQFHVKDEMVKRGQELSERFGRKIEGFDAFVEIARQEQYEAREWTYVRKDGSTFPVQLVVTAIYNKEKEVSGYLGVGTDISEIKKGENEVKSVLGIATEQNSRLKNFAHIVSHNLRSLSGNISALLNLYIEVNPGIEKDDFVSRMKTGADNLRETINELSEIVNINTSVLEELMPVSLFHSIQSAINNVSQLARESSVVIENKVDPSIHILGFPAYVNSILLNFITNGIKYRAKNRPPYIRLTVESEYEFWVLSIEDNGLGIDLDLYKDRLFGMYKTFHGNADARGIGLYITKNQVEAIGGKIEVLSTPDKGSVFKVYFKKA